MTEPRDRTLERKLAAELRGLDPRALDDLRDRSDRDPAENMADPAWSRGAVRMLDASSRAALRLLAQLPHGANPVHLDAMAATIVGDGARASRQLVAAGIAFSEPDQWDRSRTGTRLRVLASLAARWKSLAEDPPPDSFPALPSDADEQFAAQRTAFELGVLLAVVSSLRPRTSRAAGLHKADLKAIRAVLGPLHASDEALWNELSRARRSDLLVERDGRLHANADLRLEPGDVFPAIFAMRATEHRSRHGFLAAIGALAATNGWVPDSQLAELIALANLSSPYAIDSPAGVRATFDAVTSLPGVTRGERDGVSFQRLASRLKSALDGARVPADREPRLLVQPNLQIVASHGASVDTLVTLSRFCRIVSVDRVALFALDADSARSAAVDGFDSSRILAFLESRAAHGVPSNVARAVFDWARVRASARLAHGTVIATDLGLEELRRIAGPNAQLEAFAPGVVLVSKDSASRLERALREAGVAVDSKAVKEDQPPADDSRNPRTRFAKLADEAREAITKLRA